jgi:hypothetical protein
MPLHPNEMVPLQIDLAIGVRRYLFGRLPDPGACPTPLGTAVTATCLRPAEVGFRAGSVDRCYVPVSGAVSPSVGSELLGETKVSSR